MAIDRRRALALVGASALFPSAGWSRGHADRYLSARTTADWRHGAALLDGDGKIVASFDLPGRGHGAAVSPGGDKAVLFARRPGTYAAVIDLGTRRLSHLVESPEDRHFYGHGCFSPDGRHLLATENDFENERGVLGVYDAGDGFRRVAELASHGLGPHEVLLMRDGETLAVANGGILTHPSAPRIKLNVADMEPSLTFVRLRDGHLLARHRLGPDLRQLSIRHLAVGARDQIAFAMQWEGHEAEMPPLVGLWSFNDGIRAISAPAAEQRSMRNYCGSVAFAAHGRSFVVSAPRGDILTAWRADGAFIGAFELRDGCAVAPRPGGGFLATGGNGDVVELEPELGILARRSHHGATMWDNHVAAL